MAAYALHDGQLIPATLSGLRGTCHDKNCGWEMISKPGQGKVQPHWAHRPGSTHVWGTGEKGEWHREVQNLFHLQGAQNEVKMTAADGTRDHFADVVCANGMIVEAQTYYLPESETESREATYNPMIWLYDDQTKPAWFNLDETRSGRFRWGKPNRRFFAHVRPVFVDTPGGVWQIDSLHPVDGRGGRQRYEGVRTRVAFNLLEFVTKITAGETFGPAPRLSAIDARESSQGTKALRVLSEAQWLADNPNCHYQPPPPRPRPAPRPSEPVRTATINDGFVTVDVEVIGFQMGGRVKIRYPGGGEVVVPRSWLS